MKKKSVLILLIISLVINVMSTIKVTAAEIPPSMQTAYDEIMDQRPAWGIINPIEDFDIDIWNDYDVLVMDIPGTYPSNLSTLKEPDGSANDYNSNAGEYRYIGKNPDGYLVNNPKYPDDHSGSATINTYDWQNNSDKQTQITPYITTMEDQAFYENEIFYFLEKEYGARFDDTEDPSRWLSNAIVIVPVSSTGDGVIKYMHKWDSNHDGIKENWYITVNLRAKDEVIPEEGTTTETSTSTGTSGTATLGDTCIAADERGAEKFDVTKGIPTSEDLYATVIASEYVHNEDYRNVSGSITYKVTVSKTYKLYKWDSHDKHVDTDGDGVKDDWKGGWDSKTETASNTYDVIRNYRFHMIDKLSVYSLSSALLNNAALPSGTLTLNSSVVAPTVSMTRDTTVENHYQTPISGTTYRLILPSETIGKSRSNRSYDSVPKENFRAVAESAIGQIKVKNDQLVFNGTTLMDGGWYEREAPTPSAIPDAPLNDSNDMYRADLTIPNTVANGIKPSTGTLTYNVVANTDTETTVTMPISDLNNVVVHTPVVCYPWLSDISLLTQYVTPESDRHQLVIEETFRLDYPTSGEHRSIQGYGDRDYADYIDHKQVAFPFDVYVGTGYDGIFVPKNTWATFSSDHRDFFIPAWVNESVGEIHFRTLPINLPSLDDSHYEYNANLDLTNYKAVETIPYRINGKLEDFSITRCPDDYWKYAFSNPTAPTRPIPRNGSQLPLSPGESVSIQGKSVSLEGIMLGYPLDFSVITNGDLYHDSDSVSLAVTWNYAPDKNGKPDLSKQIPVDLYRMTASALAPIPKERLNLGASNRSFIGIQNPDGSPVRLPSGMSTSMASTSRQQWDGQFLLSNMTYAVPQGTPVATLSQVDVNQAPFLHDGYLVAHVKVFGQKNGHDYMEYGSMWEAEGYNNNALNGLTRGDLFFYSTDRRASQTYR